MKKCAVPNCTKLLAADYPKKTCPHCLQLASARTKKYLGTAKGQATRKAASTSEAVKAYDRSDKRKKAKKERYNTETAKEKRRSAEFRTKKKIASHKYNQSPKGIAQRKKMIKRIGVKICGMLDGSKSTSASVADFTGWTSNDEIVAHFESTMESWMNWENHGVRKVGDPPQTVWHIGHIIPKAAYDCTDIDDIRRCWQPCNLFAQDAHENQENHTKLPPQDQLLKLQAIWPASWNGTIPL